VSYRVRFTEEAKKDLERLYSFLLEKDLELAAEAVDAIDQALTVLKKFPFSCRKAGVAGTAHFFANSSSLSAALAMSCCLRSVGETRSRSSQYVTSAKAISTDSPSAASAMKKGTLRKAS